MMDDVKALDQLEHVHLDATLPRPDSTPDWLMMVLHPLIRRLFNENTYNVNGQEGSDELTA